MNDKTFKIQVKTREGSMYEGPMDLLWKLIESYEVDIFDVSLTRITDDFISYIESHNMNIELASDFVEMAARLIYHKSKLLLPDPGFEEEYEDDSLPFELVEQLLEYKRFQNAANIIQQFEEAANMSFTRESAWQEHEEESGYLKVDLIDFLRIFREFLDRKEKSKAIEIEDEEFTIEDIVDEMKIFLQNQGQGQLLFFHYIDKMSLLRSIGCFLAILELAKTEDIDIEQTKMYADLIITLRSTREATAI